MNKREKKERSANTNVKQNRKPIEANISEVKAIYGLGAGKKKTKHVYKCIQQTEVK